MDQENSLPQRAFDMSINTPGSDTTMVDADTSKVTDEDKELALGRFASITAY